MYMNVGDQVSKESEGSILESSEEFRASHPLEWLGLSASHDTISGLDNGIRTL